MINQSFKITDKFFDICPFIVIHLNFSTLSSIYINKDLSKENYLSIAIYLLLLEYKLLNVCVFRVIY